MATTIDNLRAEHWVTVLQDFTDAAGITLRAGERGVLRKISFNDIRLEIYLEIERAEGKVALMFKVKSPTGPRIGHMKEFFELGEDASPVRALVRRDPAVRQMVIPPPIKGPASVPDGPDRLEAVEQQISRDIPHLGSAASIAEMYAQRMRAFQRAGNEARAVAAFKLATQWMSTYAGYATSGGEGEALSYERDQFHAALVREFGYDPTETPR